MKPITSREKRTFGCLALVTLLVLGGAWAWHSFFSLPQINIPNPTLPSPNAYDTYVVAGNLRVGPSAIALKALKRPLDNGKRPPVENFRRYAAPVVANTVKANEAALARLRSGFAQEYLQPPLRGTMSDLTSEHRDFRELARLLALESGHRAAKGDYKGGAQSALDILRFGSDIPRGAPLIGALVGYAVDAIGRRQLELLLPHLTAAECKTIVRRMEEIEARRVPYSQTIQEEKYVVLSSLLTMMQQPGGMGMQAAGYDSKTKKARFGLVSKRRVINDVTDYMDALSASAKQPYAKAATPPLPGTFWMSSIAPVLTRGRYNHARLEAANALLKTAFALRAYRFEKGAYPENLKALVPTYLKSISADSFGSGEALRYKKQGDDYKLWSIGPDKADDSGKPIDNGKQSGRYLVRDDSKGDFVFGVNH
jgi:hypothetical protein